MRVTGLLASLLCLGASPLWAQGDAETLDCLQMANPEWRFEPTNAEHLGEDAWLTAQRAVHAAADPSDVGLPDLDLALCGLMAAELAFAELSLSPVRFQSELSEQSVFLSTPMFEHWHVRVEPFEAVRAAEYGFLRMLGLSDAALAKQVRFLWDEDGVEITLTTSVSQPGVDQCDQWNPHAFLNAVTTGAVVVQNVRYDVTRVDATHWLNPVNEIQFRETFSPMSPCGFSIRFDRAS